MSGELLPPTVLHPPTVPRPQDDEAIAEMCRWLKAHEMVAVTSRSGKLSLIPARMAYGPGWTPKRKT